MDPGLLQSPLLFIQFSAWPNSRLHALNKTGLFVIPAEDTARIYDFVHLSERHPVHPLIQLVKVCLYLLIVIGIVFVITFVEHTQDRLCIAKNRLMGQCIFFQCINVLLDHA